MKLLANENFPQASVRYLRDKGYDITAIGEDNPSIKDDVVMSIAMQENRTILTFDRDYGELIFKHNYKPAKGVVYLRIFEYEPLEPSVLIERLIFQGDIDFDNALTVVDSNGIRQRKY
jgi:predicted nuclease of predicted toxin-antitoxin system